MLVLDSIRTMQNRTSWHISYILFIKNIFKKRAQKISSHSDAQKGKEKSSLILLWKKINKNRSQNIIKASAFYKKQNFFSFFLIKHSFGTRAKCICGC